MANISVAYYHVSLQSLHRVCLVLEKTLESPLESKEIKPVFKEIKPVLKESSRKSTLNIHSFSGLGFLPLFLCFHAFLCAHLHDVIYFQRSLDSALWGGRGTQDLDSPACSTVIST